MCWFVRIWELQFLRDAARDVDDLEMETSTPVCAPGTSGQQKTWLIED